MALIAQDSKKDDFEKNILSIQAGLAIPSDDLSNASKDDVSASAASGVTAGFDYQRNVSKYFGINVLARAYTFPVDENTTLSDFEDNPSAVYSLDAEPYVLGFAGLGFTAQYGGILQGYVSPFVGYGGIRNPEIVVGETIGVNYEKLTRDFSSDFGVMYGANFGVRVKLAKVLLLGVNAEYITASPFEFEGDISTQQNNNPQQMTSYKYKQDFTTFSLALKIGFVF
tara:strand:- start:167 stop:844 length:678 start_codon:yes stop_codon:yes gene_type:complete